MKRNILISFAGMTLLSAGLMQTVQTNNTVQAATVKIVKKARLSHNAYIYNIKGKRLSSNLIKKGTSFKVLSVKKINGKKYAHIGKNQYIKLANFTKQSKRNIVEATTVLVSKNSYIYNARGHRVGRKTIKSGKVVPILKTVTIKGKKYIQISKNQFIKAVNVTFGTVTEENNKTVNRTSNSKQSHNVYQNNSNSVTSNTANNNSSSTGSSQGITSSSQNNAPVQGSNSASSSNVNNNSTTDSGNVVDDEYGDYTVLHNSWLYDKNGNRILGSWIKKGTQVEADKKVQINGKDYYYAGEYSFVPISAFEKSGKDIKPNPATDKEFADYMAKKAKASQNIYDSATYSFATKDARQRFDNASRQMENVLCFKYSSLADLKQALTELENAIQGLNGKLVVVKGTWNNYKLNETQKQEIIKLVNRCYNTNDARFEGDNTIFYSVGDHLRQCPAGQFIQFENTTSVSPKPTVDVSSKPENNVGKTLALKSSAYLYDAKGKHILAPVYLTKGTKFNIINLATINNKKYYQVYYYGNEKYIPVIAFTSKSKDEKVEKATNQSLKALKKLWAKYYNLGTGLNDRYRLSSANLRSNFDKALQLTSTVAESKYANNDDVERTQSQLVEAYQALNGAEIKLPQGMTIKTMDPQTKQSVLNLVNSIYGCSDAMFTEDNSEIVYSEDFGDLATISTDEFVQEHLDLK
ncbi:SLAP domain-containing protein [Lactobacillus helveticus]|uniref:SLAP domain-containing protein n=1 Tax=Lactobacillus helveticus TaxID=1587 RepID=UPI0015626D08|nr:SLAP domain-containing protein [Lactobacillus helveticus]NRN73430.1 hypothetical protein [Lactobacillus helveticus]NRN98421.1 hypothetical protein [Lactobacillus helveticus]